MSKVYSDQIERVQLLLAGLKKNLNLVQEKGLDEAFIKQMEADVLLAGSYNKKNEELKAELKISIHQANAKLEDLKKQVQLAKKIIKKDFLQENWCNFGIIDKR